MLEAGPVGEHDHEGGGLDVLEDEPDQVERRAVGPVQVVEHDQHGPVAGSGAEELPHTCEDLALLVLLGHAHAGRGVGQAQEGADEQGGLLVDTEGGDLLFEVVEVAGEAPEDGLDQIEEGAEGPPGPAGDAEVGAVRAGGELGEQS